VSGAYQPTLKGTKDGFLAVMSADGRTLSSATYFGGSDSDEINGLAADPFGNLVVVGNTFSSDLPVPNALLPYSSLAIIYIYVFTGLPAYEKGFVAKFGQSPLSLRWATFVGGTIDCCDEANGVAVDAAGTSTSWGAPGWTGTTSFPKCSRTSRAPWYARATAAR
jgi:hypothetical protein